MRNKTGQEQEKTSSKQEMVTVKLINIQGLIKAKYVEIENLQKIFNKKPV